MIEEFRDIPGYANKYSISNYGRIKSIKSGRIMKTPLNGGGYPNCNLYKDGIKENKTLHLLVAKTFFNHFSDGHTIVIDHINGDKTNNNINNLRMVTHRDNISVCYRKNKDSITSSLPGVSWFCRDNKWQAGICINGKRKNLGLFNSETEAYDVYQKHLLMFGC